MQNGLRVAGTWGSILVILALVITLLKQIIGFIGFMTVVIKFAIVIAFVLMVVGIGFLILKSWKSKKREGENA